MSRRASLHRWAPLARAAVALAALGLTWTPIACSTCDGEEIDGKCVPHCDDADCGGGACFDGLCRPACGSSADCAGGGKCQTVKTRSGFQGQLCIGGDPPPESVLGKACSRSDECAPGSGSRCVGGKCTLVCALHEQCGSSGSCTGRATDAEGGRVNVCEADGAQRGTGQYGTACPYGDECDDAGGFLCVGAGPGDADAYCSGTCAADDDCPSGSFCALESSAAAPCTDVCGPPGESTGDCITDDRIGDGKEFACGPLGLRRRICRARSFCSPCETNADCLGKASQVCARDESGAKICTKLCDPGAGSCPWGNATRCGVWDDELGVATCSHRFGSCDGTGESCHPCVDEAGCPNGFCNRSQFTGERYCVDFTAVCSCPPGTTSACAGGGCPLTPPPGDQQMICFGGANFVGTPYESACIGAATTRAQDGEPDSCWP